jgi:PAB1-binding protein PBP1
MAIINYNATDVRPLPGAHVQRFAAGATVTVGQAVRINNVGRVVPAAANAAGTVQAIGIVVSAPDGRTSADADEMVDVVMGGPVAGFTGMTPGSLLYTAVTAGAIDDVSPTGTNFRWVVGRAISSQTVFVAPFTDTFAAVG